MAQPTNPITLLRFLLTHEKEVTTNTDLEMVFASLSLACKVTSQAVRRAGVTGLYGLDGSTNSSGDDVKKLDILANDVFRNALEV